MNATFQEEALGDPVMDEEEGSESNGLPMSAVIAIIVVCAIAFLIVIVLFILWLCRRRSEDAKSTEPDGPPRLKTLGTHYKIASLDWLTVSDKRKLSLASDCRKLSDSSRAEALATTQEEHEELLHSNGHNGHQPPRLPFRLHKTKEFEEMRTNTFVGTSEFTDPVYRPDTPDDLDVASNTDDHSDNFKMTPMSGRSSQLSPSQHAPLHLKGSMYLDVTSTPSRRSSHSSQDVSMDDLDRESRTVIEGLRPLTQMGHEPSPIRVAPIADCESLSPSLASSLDSMPQKLFNSRQKTSTPTERPQSDGKVCDETRPKLPMKHRKMMAHRSVADVLDQSPVFPRTPPSSARSDSCLVHPELDYDDLPPSPKHRPLLPPKARPRLPPKQRIGKSKEDLEQIEHKFKTSLSELRQRKMEDELDYEELEDPVNVTGRHSPTDYDDPHSVDVKADPAAMHEYLDYDDPIHHSLA